MRAESKHALWRVDINDMGTVQIFEGNDRVAILLVSGGQQVNEDYAKSIVACHNNDNPEAVGGVIEAAVNVVDAPCNDNAYLTGLPRQRLRAALANLKEQK